jgi:hypothetical protein
VTVVAPSHPLANLRDTIAANIAERHVQIVLTDRSVLSAGQEFGVLGGQSWRVTELSTKHAFLCAGWAGAICLTPPSPMISPPAASS